MAPQGRSWRRWAANLTLLLVVCGLFAITVRERRPWFGKPADGHLFWLTAHSWSLLENWWEEGAWTSRFADFRNPRSVEHRTLAERAPYASYPEGAFVLPFAIARLTRTRPSPSFLMAYDLANHLAIALLLAWLGVALARRTFDEPWFAALFGLLPAATMLLLPGPMYWLQNVYFADQAVILPFTLVLVLEWVRGGEGRLSRAARRAQPWVVLWGCLVDYLFVFVTLALFAKRWLAGEYGRRPPRRLAAAARFGLPPLAALGLFALQLSFVDGYGLVFRKAMWRTSAPTLGDGGPPADPLWFWLPHARSQYGDLGVGLLAVSSLLLLALAGVVAIRTVRDDPHGRQAARLTAVGLLALLPCVAQLAALRQHSGVHDFSVLKLALPLALLPGVVLPLAAVELLRRRGLAAHADRRATHAIAILAAVVSLGLIVREHPKFARQFPKPVVRFSGAANLVRASTGYRDIVFSPDIAIDLFPPQLVAIARQRVYKVDGPAEFEVEAARRTAGIREPFRLCVLFLSREIGDQWRPLLAGAELYRTGAPRLFCGVRANSAEAKALAAETASPPPPR